MPIWQCSSCEHQVCIGSKEELEELSTNNIPHDLHRPFIDEVKLACPKCSSEMNRFKEVIDVWFDSGAMPFAQWHYPFENTDKIDSQSHFPADYIAEAIDQTRGWFYTLLAISTLLDYKIPPYRACLTFGHLLDKNGKKMSKSKGNVIDPWELADKYGIDPLRLHFCSMNQPGDTKKLDEKDIEQVSRKNFYLAWNIYSFLSSAALRIDWRPNSVEILDGNVLDQWLAAYTANIAQDIAENLDRYDIFRASRLLIEYINKLSTWYLRLSRKRDDSTFLPTLYWSLRQLAKMMAPFSPFFADFLWQNLRLDSDEESVHLEKWPKYEVDFSKLKMMSLVEQIIELGRSRRAEEGVKLRQPLSSLIIKGMDGQLTDELKEIVTTELNVKSIQFLDGKDLDVTFDFELTDDLLAEGLSRDLARAIQQLRKDEKLKVNELVQIIITGTHPLLTKLKLFQSQLEEATKAKIDWQNSKVGTGETEVEGLSISLK